MNEILLIAPYRQMYHSALELVSDSKYRSIKVVYGNLTEGLALAIDAVESHVRVIISRGGTYRLISQANIGVPVVEIRSSPFDLLESLAAAMETHSPLAIVGYSNIINGYDEKFLRKLVGTQMIIVNLEERDDVRQVIDACAAKGYSVFLGDAVVKNVCDEAGYACYLQQSGSSSIQSAMDEALRICGALKQERKLTKRLSALIDFVHDGIIAIDGEGKVIVLNAIAYELLGITEKKIHGSPVNALSGFPFITALKSNEQMVDRPYTIGNRLISVSIVPVAMEGESFGTLAIIRDVQEQQAYEQKLRASLSEKGFVARHTFDSIVHSSRELNHCITVAKKFSRNEASVLIEGESGVGKELFAQSIHNHSDKKKGPFVAVNCAVMPQSLIESELFGYVEGAFTGSKKGGKAGYFELAHKGTLFLDEISELPLDVQAHLLRVIQEKEVMRLGDTRILPVEVRLICASNKNLVDMARRGLFRKDLLFRINTLSLYIPPLSCRRDDISLLSAHFLFQFSASYGKNIAGFSPKAAEYLRQYNYEGNVRELRGMIERAVIICEGDVIRLSDLRQGLRQEFLSPPESAGLETEEIRFAEAPVNLAEAENAHIRRIFAANNKSMTKTAGALGISRSTLWRKLGRL